MQGRKSTQKSRHSTDKKSQKPKKPINQKDKIVNVIKKSTLLTSHSTKTRTSSKSKLPQTQKKTYKNPYKIQSQRHRPSKLISTVSKSMPVINQKPKMMQFPFEAIKFKQREENKIIQSKTHDQFYIQYDEPQETQIDLSVMNNSKKILGTYNQRVGRYNELKSKAKVQFISSQVKNVQFKQAVIKLFKFLDPNSNRVLSHDQIDYRKLPQGVLYFLGGLFHRIRQKNLLLSQNQFLQECTLLYKRSSNQDVKWFIQEVLALVSKSQQISMKKLEPHMISNYQFGIINKECLKKLKVQEKQQISTKNIPKLAQSYNNLSFNHEQQEFGISFRNQVKENEYNTKQSNPSEKESVRSANFGRLQNRFSFSNENRKQSGLNLQIEHKHEQNQNNQIKQKNQVSKIQQKQLETIRTVGIKRNIVDKAQDIREQIYAKMDKMKLSIENKENLLLKQNFSSKSKYSPIKITHQQDPHQSHQNYLEQNYSKTINIRQKKITDSFIPKDQKPFIQERFNQSQSKDQKMQPTNKTYNRDPLAEKNAGWVNKVTNCQKAFDELQKMRKQFNQQKRIIEKRQVLRQNYLKDNPKKNNPLIQDFILEDQTRVLKLTEKRRVLQKFQQRQSLTYERNIDRLAILSNSRDNKSKTININESLANSCRKSLQVSIPVMNRGQKAMSLSDKRPSGFQKTDKIEELSQKLEKYLKTNAQKIQYSKNFTETPTGVGYNKILAM